MASLSYVLTAILHLIRASIDIEATDYRIQMKKLSSDKYKYDYSDRRDGGTAEGS